MLAKAIPADEPGAVVIAVKDGKTVFRKARGRANPELGVPLPPDSVLRLGSITKQFTATAVLILREEGKRSFERALTPAVTRDGKATHDGYGWGISTLRGARALAHGGGIFGFSTYGIRLPDGRVYDAVLANSDSPKAEPGMLGKRIAAFLIGRPFPARVPVPVDPKVLARWTGVSRFDPQTTRTVTVEAEEVTGSYSFAARATSSSLFSRTCDEAGDSSRR